MSGRMARIIVGVALVLMVALGVTCLTAQSPRTETAVPAPPAIISYETERGTVKDFTKSPTGEIDGLILANGKVVHWPLRLSEKFTAIVSKGSTIRVTGFWEVGPTGARRLEVSTLTNLETNRTEENPDRPARPVPGEIERVRTVEERLQAIEAKIDLILVELKKLHR
jgi:hypothetical protein